ncbi:MAG: hypothetical protein H3Z51_08865 [archaeon]|nr:hypothetical protein [archaeon]
MNRREIASAIALALMILMVFSWDVPVVLTQLETYDYGDAPVWRAGQSDLPGAV